MTTQSSVNLNCPNCTETIVAVLPGNISTTRVTCPKCNDEFSLVKTNQNESTDKGDSTEKLSATVQNWNWADERDPYSGNETDIPVEQRVKADVQMNNSTYSFDLYYTPEFGYFKHVVRGQLESGQKSKNAFKDEDSGELYFKNRGVPSDGKKQWTYLNEDECRTRSDIAGLGTVKPDTKTGKSNRFRTYLGKHSRPLVDENDMLNEELVEALVKGLVVFQTKL